jgi:hypothetical protein
MRHLLEKPTSSTSVNVLNQQIFKDLHIYKRMIGAHVVLILIFTGHAHCMLLVSLLLSFRRTHEDFGTRDKKYSTP